MVKELRISTRLGFLGSEFLVMQLGQDITGLVKSEHQLENEQEEDGSNMSSNYSSHSKAYVLSSLMTLRPAFY